MKNKDAPAFPCNMIDGEMQQDSSGQIIGFKKIKSLGLTKREYFAGLAMQSCIHYSSGHFTPDTVAEKAVEYADKLLKELQAVSPISKTSGNKQMNEEKS